MLVSLDRIKALTRMRVSKPSKEERLKLSLQEWASNEFNGKIDIHQVSFALRRKNRAMRCVDEEVVVLRDIQRPLIFFADEPETDPFEIDINALFQDGFGDRLRNNEVHMVMAAEGLGHHRSDFFASTQR
jgi:hypothetical protein